MKKLLYILVLFFLAYLNNPLFSQGWEKLYDYSIPTTLTATQDGHFVLVSNHSRHIWKVDSNGVEIWNNTLPLDGLSIFTSLSDVMETTDGHIVTVGAKGVIGENNSAAYINKIDAQGNELWHQTYTFDSTGLHRVESVVESHDGHYLLFGQEDLDGTSFVQESDLFLIKVSSINGEELWRKSFSATPESVDYAADILKHPNGGYTLLGFTINENPVSRLNLIRVDDDGVVLWSKLLEETANISTSRSLLLLPDGNYMIATPQGIYSDAKIALIKTDALGNELWTKTVYDSGNADHIYDFKHATDGGFVMAGISGSTEEGFGGQDELIIKTNSEGEVEWYRLYGSPLHDLATGIYPLESGSYLMAGSKKEFYFSTNFNGSIARSHLIKMDSLGFAFRNKIQGNVFEDLDLDCDSIPEAGLNGWLVELISDPYQFTITDSLGNYCFAADTGSYELKVHPVSPYWQACEEVQGVSLGLIDTTTTNFPIQAETECPYLVVDISTPFLRRCFDNEYTVSFCNSGTIAAEEAYVEVELDEYLVFNSSTIPLTSQDGNLYRFDIGHIEVGACDRFKINVTVDCDSTDLGQTHCVQANIYPDSLCIPTPNWSGASIELDASCTGDSVVFTITNVGTAPTSPDLDFLVIEDEVILLQDEFNLGVDQSITVSFAATGSTFQLQAEQEPNHPGDNNPNITVEGCGSEGSEVSYGFVTQFLENDGNPFVSIDCQENVGSWDPNDKRAFPKGYGENHFIEANTDIEYHIRFQNTGSDTAFNVVIRDALSENLNLNSIRTGASSHPYEFSIGPDRTLEFTFSNIMLPDSNVNEPASHGFVKFKVSQVPNLADGEMIFNGAAIYFDFNEPVLTNVVFHTIGREFIPTSIIENNTSSVAARVFPNPFDEQATFELSGEESTQNLHFYLMDIQGKLVRKQQFNGNTFEFHRNGLPRGIYLYRIEREGSIINSGKIITQ